jgi:RHS repeat-associated protein
LKSTVNCGFYLGAGHTGVLRYGFGGHEKDDEIKGSGNHISFNDYGYDPRTGRRWQHDPIKQVGISPYATFNNNPIFYSDPDGQSPITPFIKMAVKKGLKIAVKEYIEQVVRKKAMDYAGKKVISKSFAKQFADDAIGAMDLMTSEWWEVGIEFIPWIGDAYGATKLYKQTKAVWDRVKALEKRLDKIADFQKGRSKFADFFTKMDGFQAHHIIPFEALTKNRYIQEAIDAGWDINKKDNGSLLANGFHANHPAYTTFY